MSAARVRIRILDSNGQPASNAALSVVRSSVPFPEIALLPDDDGALELRLPAGTYTFEALDATRRGEAVVTSDGIGRIVVDIALH